MKRGSGKEERETLAPKLGEFLGEGHVRGVVCSPVSLALRPFTERQMRSETLDAVLHAPLGAS